MWIKPKIEYSDGYFNAVDYNRIKNNLKVLRELAIIIYEEFSIQDMGPDKTYSDFLYADEINTIENNLDKINKNSVNGNYGTKLTFNANDRVPTLREIIRIEKAILDIYTRLNYMMEKMRHFNFNFGDKEEF